MGIRHFADGDGEEKRARGRKGKRLRGKPSFSPMVCVLSLDLDGMRAQEMKSRS